MRSPLGHRPRGVGRNQLERGGPQPRRIGIESQYQLRTTLRYAAGEPVAEPTRRRVQLVGTARDPAPRCDTLDWGRGAADWGRGAADALLFG